MKEIWAFSTHRPLNDVFEDAFTSRSALGLNCTAHKAQAQLELSLRGFIAIAFTHPGSSTRLISVVSARWTTGGLIYGENKCTIFEFPTARRSHSGHYSIDRRIREDRCLVNGFSHAASRLLMQGRKPRHRSVVLFKHQCRL